LQHCQAESYIKYKIIKLGAITSTTAARAQSPASVSLIA
jgi:hypothetical protein